MTYWGGLQDNGTSKLAPYASKNIEPAGGDGGNVLVNPDNGQQAVGEYTNLAMYSTTDGGHTSAVITDLGVLEPGADRELELRAVYPGVTTDDVQAATGWELRVAAELRTVDEPSAGELEALRDLLSR